MYEPPPPGKPGRPRKYGDRITKAKLKTLAQTHTELPIYGSHRTVRYRTAVCMVRFLGGRLVRAVWVSMFVDGKWKAERLLLSTDPRHPAEDVIMTYSLRWTIEPMFAALKGGEGMIDMWMQSVETFHRWLSIVQIGRAQREHDVVQLRHRALKEIADRSQGLVGFGGLVEPAVGLRGGQPDRAGLIERAGDQGRHVRQGTPEAL